MTVRQYVTEALERFPETRKDRFELVRRVYHAISAKREERAEQYREEYSPREDPDQTKLF